MQRPSRLGFIICASSRCADEMNRWVSSLQAFIVSSLAGTGTGGIGDGFDPDNPIRHFDQPRRLEKIGLFEKRGVGFTVG